MAIDFKKAMVRQALKLIPADMMEQVPAMIVGAIADKMDSVVTFPGEEATIQINKIDGELYIDVNVTDSEGGYVRTDERLNTKDFIRHLINMGTNGI